MGRGRKIELPQNLVDAVREQRAILFLGSGASLGAVNRSGAAMPGATDLPKAIATKFLTPKSAKDGLMVVAELAASEAGSSVFNQWLADTFEAFEPTDAHLKLPTFRWKAIATTNYDVLVEKAYDRSRDATQSLVARYKDDQPFGSMMDAQERPLPFLKLHGCARHAHDAQVPLVLTPSSYNNHEANRSRLYRHLEDLAADYTVIYCGQSLSDLHIRRLSQEGNRSARPFHFLVVPDLDEVKKRFWADHRVEGGLCNVHGLRERLGDGPAAPYAASTPRSRGRIQALPDVLHRQPGRVGPAGCSISDRPATGPLRSPRRVG